LSIKRHTIIVIRAVKRLIFFNRVNCMINYFNRALTRQLTRQFDRSSYVVGCHQRTTARLAVHDSSTDAATVEFAVKQ